MSAALPGSGSLRAPGSPCDGGAGASSAPGTLRRPLPDPVYLKQSRELLLSPLVLEVGGGEPSAARLGVGGASFRLCRRFGSVPRGAAEPLGARSSGAALAAQADPAASSSPRAAAATALGWAAAPPSPVPPGGSRHAVPTVSPLASVPSQRTSPAAGRARRVPGDAGGLRGARCSEAAALRGRPGGSGSGSWLRNPPGLCALRPPRVPAAKGAQDERPVGEQDERPVSARPPVPCSGRGGRLSPARISRLGAAPQCRR